MSEEMNNAQAQIWSQIQLENQKINPHQTEENARRINRNLQLGNLDHRQFFHLSIKAQKALQFASSTNPIYRRYGLSVLDAIEHTNVLSGSKGGFVRQSLNTQIQKQELKEESNNGLFSGLFGKNKR